MSRHPEEQVQSEPLSLEEYWRSEEGSFKHHSGALRKEVAFGNAVFQFFQVVILQSRGTANPPERAVFELIHLATRHFGAALTLAARGCTTEVVALMRSVIEAIDDARRVRESRELAGAWLQGPKQFKEKATELRLWRFQGPMKGLRDAYDRYCDYGSHPNVGAAQALFDTNDPARNVLSFRKGDADEMRLYLLTCGFAGHHAADALVSVLWPNVRPPEILTRMDKLNLMQSELTREWRARRGRSSLILP